MRIFLTFILMLSLTCCGKSNLPNPYALSEKEAAVNRVFKKAFLQLKKEKELYSFGLVRGQGVLGLAFRYYKTVDIDIARELLTYSTTLFLNIINESEDIRPYLKVYPFNPENIEIEIYLQTSNGSEPKLGKWTLLEMRHGKLKYYVRNLKTEMLMTLYEETFEEAVAKLNEKVAI